MSEDIDIEAEIAWLKERKAEIDTQTGKAVSWEKLSKSAGIPAGTLSSVSGGTYGGVLLNVASKIAKWRTQLDQRAGIVAGIPVDPGYIRMPTAETIRGLLAIAHTGQITMVCTGPGTCKTFVAEDYRQTTGNTAFMMTMDPVNNRLTPFVFMALKAVGGSARGATAWMSEQFKELVRGRKAMLIVDEANHLTHECLEQLRAWHDTTGVGLCLLGNEELYATIKSGKKRHAFGRLASRIDTYLLQEGPRPEDLDIFLDQWGVSEDAQRNFLGKIGMSIGGGGLRDVSKVIRNGSMLASAEGKPLKLSHLQEAQASRITRFMRAVQ